MTFNLVILNYCPTINSEFSSTFLMQHFQAQLQFYKHQEYRQKSLLKLGFFYEWKNPFSWSKCSFWPNRLLLVAFSSLHLKFKLSFILQFVSQVAMQQTLLIVDLKSYFNGISLLVFLLVFQECSFALGHFSSITWCNIPSAIFL